VTIQALRAASVPEVATWIRDAVAPVESRIDRAVAELEAVRRGNGLGVLPRLRSVRPDVGFLVTNLSRIPFAALDFGQGPPVEIVPAALPLPRDRCCAVLRDGDRLRLIHTRPQ
jgi:hypothetical protein